MRLSPAHAASLFNEQNIPVSGTAYNDCGGEDMVLGGAMHIAVQSTTDGAGGFHYDVQVNPQGETGVGVTSGVTYQISGGHHASIYDPTGNGFTETNSQYGRVIGPGPDNNSLFRFLFHLTVTPDGTTTASFTDFEFVCQ